MVGVAEAERVSIGRGRYVEVGVEMFVVCFDGRLNGV